MTETPDPTAMPQDWEYEPETMPDHDPPEDQPPPEDFETPSHTARLLSDQGSQTLLAPDEPQPNERLNSEPMLDEPSELQAHLGGQTEPPPDASRVPMQGPLAPTLQIIPAHRRPQRGYPYIETACETCPISLWFASPTDLKCMCRAMSILTWETVQPGDIEVCDAREQALIEQAASL